MFSAREAEHEASRCVTRPYYDSPFVGTVGEAHVVSRALTSTRQRVSLANVGRDTLAELTDRIFRANLKRIALVHPISARVLRARRART
jgi:hypothetical protein